MNEFTVIAVVAGKWEDEDCYKCVPLYIYDCMGTLDKEPVIIKVPYTCIIYGKVPGKGEVIKLRGYLEVDGGRLVPIITGISRFFPDGYDYDDDEGDEE
jgi:hypothetical protein